MKLLKTRRCALALFIALAFGAGMWGRTSIAEAQFTSGPSLLCHETDGAFTVCLDGETEWSDIQGAEFFDAAGKLLSVLYVDQADKDPRSIPNGSGLDTLMLMYDEVARTQPLGLAESVHVHFMTVDSSTLELLHYDVDIGTAGLQRVLLNGVEQDPMPSGLRGIASFGLSPNSPDPHVIAELQIGLEAAGFEVFECCYSPDPAWWGSSVPLPIEPQDPRCQPRPGQPDGECPTEPKSTTAAIFTANLDGTTTVVPQPLLPPGTEPPLCETIGRVVDFRVPPGAPYKNHGEYVKQVAQLTEALVDSQVAAGIISPEEGEELQSCVVNPRARSSVGKG